MVWTYFGFTENLYGTEPIPASEEGDHLLVGREREVKVLEDRVLAGSTHLTLEGDNGVGKTSLVSVMCYRLRTEAETGRISPVFLPVTDDVDDWFQLLADESSESFVQRVYFKIASAIVNQHGFLKARGLRVPQVSDVRSWLNSPIVTSWGVSASAFGAGVGGSRGRSVNTSSGFAEIGLMDMVNRWLRQLFPTSQAGGFVCVIDNLELLETTQKARTLLEAIRDPLLNRRGLRWILCGARGIMRTSAASPRLAGRLAEPLEIRPISDDYVEAAIERRIARFQLFDDAVAPVGPNSFRRLYEVLNRNLRDAFKHAEDFAFWLHDQGEKNRTTSSYDALFQVWLAMQADRYLADTQLGPRAWQVFDRLADRDGWCSPSDFGAFGFNRQNVMRTHIKALEAANLVTSSLSDESDKRRKTIMMTARGWLVRYARRGYQPPAVGPAVG